MHYWPNKSIIKTLKAFNLKALKSARPKGIDDNTWQEMLREEKTNKLIMMNALPKVSAKASQQKNG